MFNVNFKVNQKFNLRKTTNRNRLLFCHVRDSIWLYIYLYNFKLYLKFKIVSFSCHFYYLLPKYSQLSIILAFRFQLNFHTN